MDIEKNYLNSMLGVYEEKIWKYTNIMTYIAHTNKYGLDNL